LRGEGPRVVRGCGESPRPAASAPASVARQLPELAAFPHRDRTPPAWRARCSTCRPGRRPHRADRATRPARRRASRERGDWVMADMQRNQIGGVKELVVLVGILLTVVAGAIGTYWVQSQGVEAASTTTTAGKVTEEPKSPRAATLAPPSGVF